MSADCHYVDGGEMLHAFDSRFLVFCQEDLPGALLPSLCLETLRETQAICGTGQPGRLRQMLADTATSQDLSTMQC